MVESIEKNAHAFIALGSNIDAAYHLPKAIAALSELGVIQACSAIYYTPPWGITDQAPFLNAVLLMHTPLEPAALLEQLMMIESQANRVRGITNGPRTIDLDVLDFQQNGQSLVQQSDTLTLPHPRLHERGFVLVPLCDIAPHWRHPTLQQSARALCDKVDCKDIKVHRLESMDDVFEKPSMVVSSQLAEQGA